MVAAIKMKMCFVFLAKQEVFLAGLKWLAWRLRDTALSALSPALNRGCLHDRSGQIMGNDVCAQLFTSIFFLIQITFTEDLASVRHQTRQLDTAIKSQESLLARTPSIPRTFLDVWPFYTLSMSNRNHLYLAYKPGNLSGRRRSWQNKEQEDRSQIPRRLWGSRRNINSFQVLALKSGFPGPFPSMPSHLAL